MLPFVTDTSVESTADLVTGLLRGMETQLRLPPDGARITLDGDFPTYASAEIDLSRGAIDLHALPDLEFEPAAEDAEVEIGTLTVRASGGRVLAGDFEADAPSVWLNVSAKEAHCNLARDREGKKLLVLTSARDGRFSASISKHDIVQAIARTAELVVQENGVKLDAMTVNLESRGSRGVLVTSEATATKRLGLFPASFTLRVRVGMHLDEQMTATVDELHAEGDGVAGKIAAGLANTYMARYRGETVSLSVLPMQDVTFSDVTIAADQEPLKISASFQVVPKADPSRPQTASSGANSG